MKNDKLIRKSVANKKRGVLRRLVKDKRVNPAVNNNICLLMACTVHNDVEMVKSLLSRPEVDINVDNGYPLNLQLKIVMTV